MMDSRPWILDASCRQHPHPEWWDAGLNRERSKRREQRQAKAIAVCAGCTVGADCLADAVPGEDEGIRAGKEMPPVTGNARRDLSQFRGDGRLRAPIRHGTEAGYMSHYRRGEPACRDCLDGYSRTRKARDAAKAQEAS